MNEAPVNHNVISHIQPKEYPEYTDYIRQEFEDRTKRFGNALGVLDKLIEEGAPRNSINYVNHADKANVLIHTASDQHLPNQFPMFEHAMHDKDRQIDRVYSRLMNPSKTGGWYANDKQDQSLKSTVQEPEVFADNTKRIPEDSNQEDTQHVYAGGGDITSDGGTTADILNANTFVEEQQYWFKDEVDPNIEFYYAMGNHDDADIKLQGSEQTAENVDHLKLVRLIEGIVKNPPSFQTLRMELPGDTSFLMIDTNVVNDNWFTTATSMIQETRNLSEPQKKYLLEFLDNHRQNQINVIQEAYKLGHKLIIHGHDPDQLFKFLDNQEFYDEDGNLIGKGIAAMNLNTIISGHTHHSRINTVGDPKFAKGNFGNLWERKQIINNRGIDVNVINTGSASGGFGQGIIFKDTQLAVSIDVKQDGSVVAYPVDVTNSFRRKQPWIKLDPIVLAPAA